MSSRHAGLEFEGVRSTITQDEIEEARHRVEHEPNTPPPPEDRQASIRSEANRVAKLLHKNRDKL